ncbi:hypothetical protein C8R44DRAFT_879440 [Mycena epipterygia]|nr:hypothetical protein C8R44DRAFT_879440 [Mycena epipterygia]
MPTFNFETLFALPLPFDFQKGEIPLVLSYDNCFVMHSASHCSPCLSAAQSDDDEPPPLLECDEDDEPPPLAEYRGGSSQCSHPLAHYIVSPSEGVTSWCRLHLMDVQRDVEHARRVRTLFLHQRDHSPPGLRAHTRAARTRMTYQIKMAKAIQAYRAACAALAACPACGSPRAKL